MDMLSIEDPITIGNHVYNRRTYGYHHSYAAIIGRTLGHDDIHNHSIPGGSTDSMVRVFRSVIDTIDPMEDLAMACWTGGDRAEYWDEEFKVWVQLTPHKTGFQLMLPSPIALQGLVHGRQYTTSRFQEEHKKWAMAASYGSAMERLEKNMLTMNQMAHECGIRLMNLCSFTTGYFPEIDKKNCWPDYSAVQHYWWPVGTKISFLEYSKKKGFQPDNWGHYNEDAHKSFAKMVLDKILENPKDTPA